MPPPTTDSSTGVKHANHDKNGVPKTDTKVNTDEAAAVDASELDRMFMLSILTAFGKAYQLLCQYKVDECIRLLNLLPRRHYSSGWVQHAVGKAYFELGDYKAAQLALREMLRLEPFRVKGTEILSTALWHLKRDKELCSLAQQVMFRYIIYAFTLEQLFVIINTLKINIIIVAVGY
jgi:anaphase-promoting complex subunit 3